MIRTWTTKDGTEMSIKDMSTSHIQNCITFLKENPLMIGHYDLEGDHYFDLDYDLTDEYIMTFQKELKKRRNKK